MRGTIAGALAAAIVIAADMLTKSLAHIGLEECVAPPVAACTRIAVAGPIGILRTANADGAFGVIGEPWLWPLIVAVLLLIAALARSGAGRATWVAPALLAGGVAANLLDRALWGAVTDFIDIRAGGADGGLVFNLADVALAAGGVLLVVVTRRRIGSPTAAGTPYSPVTSG